VQFSASRYFIKEADVDTGIIRNKWLQLVGDFRHRWGKPVAEDMDKVNGDAEKFISKLQERYGYARDPGLGLDELMNSGNITPKAKRAQTGISSAR